MDVKTDLTSLGMSRMYVPFEQQEVALPGWFYFPQQFMYVLLWYVLASSTNIHIWTTLITYIQHNFTFLTDVHMRLYVYTLWFSKLAAVEQWTAEQRTMMMHAVFESLHLRGRWHDEQRGDFGAWGGTVDISGAMRLLEWMGQRNMGRMVQSHRTWKLWRQANHSLTNLVDLWSTLKKSQTPVQSSAVSSSWKRPVAQAKERSAKRTRNLDAGCICACSVCKKILLVGKQAQLNLLKGASVNSHSFCLRGPFLALFGGQLSHCVCQLQFHHCLHCFCLWLTARAS